MKKAFLDLDGTLLDSRERHQVVLHDVLEENGCTDLNISDYLQFKAYGLRTIDYLLMRLHLPEGISYEVDKMWKDRIEEANYLQMDQWYDGTEIFLKKLKELGFFTIVLSARKNAEYPVKMIRDSFLSSFIDDVVIVSPMNATYYKEKVLRKQADKDSIFVGDTETDFDSGERAKIKTYILNSGFRNKSFWKKRGIANYNSLDEILREIGAI